MGILVYFNTNDQASLNLIIVLTILNLVLFSLICFFLTNFKYIQLALLITTFILIGYGAIVFRVQNIKNTHLNHIVQSKIIAEVAEVEIRGNEKKLLLNKVKFLDSSINKNIKKVKIVVRTKLDNIKNMDKIIANVNLMPPPAPVLPGSFDYARYAFFNDIDGIGYAMGNVKIIQRSDINTFSTIAKLKEVISKSFYDNMEAKNAAIASALFLGNTKKIDPSTYDNIRISGIAHLLAISGMHVALVAGIIFVTSSIIFSKIYNPFIKINNKKISAVITICFSYFYLLIANAPISAQRAFTMTTLFLIGILIDRETNPVRTIGFAALIILLITPEALLSASLQMSFSACLSLIYGFKFLKRIPLFCFNSNTSTTTKFFSYFLSIILASIFATLATSIFIMFHFKNFSTYSLLTNLLAIPIAEFIIMPCGMLAIALLPIKLEFLAFYPMEIGIKILLYISDKIASFPGATFNVYKVDSSSLFLFVIGCLCFMIVKTRLKYVGILPIITAFIVIINFELPDIAISKTGKLIAVKDLGDNRLQLINGFRERYSKKIWQKELNIKQTNKNYLNKVCNKTYCYIAEHKLFILINNYHYKDVIKICNDINETKIFLNLTNNNLHCKNAILTINMLELKVNGSYLIFNNKGKLKVITDKDHLVKKPWVKVF